MNHTTLMLSTLHPDFAQGYVGHSKTSMDSGRMTRKILITLCTLLAVGSGSYVQAAFEGHTVDVSAGKPKTGTPVEGRTGETAEQQAAREAKEGQSTNANQQTMTMTNGKPTPDKFDIASSFNLENTDGYNVSPYPKRESNGDMTYSLNTGQKGDSTYNPNAPVYKITVDSTGKVVGKSKLKNAFDPVGVAYDPVARDSKGNPLTKQQAYDKTQQKSEQAKSLSLKNNTTGQVDINNPEVQAQAQAAPEASGFKSYVDYKAEVDRRDSPATPEQQAIIDKNQSNFDSALQSGDSSAVNDVLNNTLEDISVQQNASPEAMNKSKNVVKEFTSNNDMNKPGVLTSFVKIVSEFFNRFIGRKRSDSSSRSASPTGVADFANQSGKETIKPGRLDDIKANVENSFNTSSDGSEKKSYYTPREKKNQSGSSPMASAGFLPQGQ